MMKLLLILLTTMTFTVQDKNTVTTDGQWPYDMDATYSCSYQKGTVRKDDVATLTVFGLGGLTVEKVDVYVKSNKTAGAGKFTVSVNGNTVGTKSGTFKDWNGAYDADNYHAIRVLNKACSNVETLSITLTGTANSLYIEKYVISYGSKPSCTVTLMYGDEVFATLREETGGQGVLIPMGSTVEGWYCVGWSETDCEQEIDVASLVKPNDKFYPTEDCTLRAIYKYTGDDEMVYGTDLQSGEYLYVNTYANIALTSVPDNKGRMAYAPVNRYDEKQVYTIDLIGNDTAYITHTLTGTPIGYEGTQMAAKKSPWLVYQEGAQILFYTEIRGKKYVLWHQVLDNYDLYAGLFQTDDFVGAPVGIIRPLELIYTCYPESGMEIETVNADPSVVNGKWVFPFGSYNLIIQDGKKRLESR